MANIVKKHIFYLGDEPTVREIIKETLEESNVKVSCFDDPVECLARLRHEKCDLLIADIKLPQKDGIEFLIEVKHLAAWIPVLMITGYGEISTVVKAIKAGAVDFIEKPLEEKNFAQKIQSILKKNVSYHPELSTFLTLTEQKILQLIIDGKSNKEIAVTLNRSSRTIEVHRAHIMRKLSVDNLVDLVKRVVSMGLVAPEEKQLSGEDRPESGNDENVIS